MFGTQGDKPRYRNERTTETPRAAGQTTPTSKLSKRRRWESNPLETALQAAAFPSGSDVDGFVTRQKMSSPGFEPGPRPSQSRVRSTTLRGQLPRRPVADNVSTPPRIRTSSGSFERCCASTTLAGQRSRFHPQYLDLESNQDLDLRRIRCDPLHHRDASTTQFKRVQSRRLGSHQHHPVYKTGALLPRATSAFNVPFEHEREESNPVKRFWRPPALPGAHSCKTHGFITRGRFVLWEGEDPAEPLPFHKRLGGSLALPGKINSPAGRSNTPR
jgi:hypothetical protein